MQEIFSKYFSWYLQLNHWSRKDMVDTNMQIIRYWIQSLFKIIFSLRRSCMFHFTPLRKISFALFKLFIERNICWTFYGNRISAFSDILARSSISLRGLKRLWGISKGRSRQTIGYFEKKWLIHHTGASSSINSLILACNRWW